MAKKVNVIFDATLKKNTAKGGAWMARVTTYDEGLDDGNVIVSTAWSNASAGKRWIKEMVIQMTPRKSVKMTPCTTTPPDEKGKPVAFEGKVEFKREI
jgi:hypothetical protein